jgi:SAM-dependent methyltransferase
MSTDPNSATLAAYEAHVAEYVSTTPHEIASGLKGWIDAALSRVKPGSTILEIGSGFGRDADYIESHGFVVIRSDAARGFVTHMRAQGHRARVLNILTQDIGGPYAMVFADAVILHFTPIQAALCFAKARKALRPGGVFAFCVKVGEGDEWSQAKLGAPRDFHYWQAAPLLAALKAAGFGPVSISTDTSSGLAWLMVVASV